MNALDLVTDRLRKYTGYEGRGGAWRCPNHDDRKPSLSVHQGDKGAVLTCHAGCDTNAVLAALHLAPADLFDQPLERTGTNGLGQIVARYPYTDEHGEVLFEVRRYDPKTFRQYRPDGNGSWTPGLNGARRPLYRLPAVLAAITIGSTVYVVEGERDVETLERAGAVATCNPMGAGKWKPEHTAALRGGSVVIVADRDNEGRAHAATVAAELRAADCAVTVVEGVVGKDITDHISAGHTLDQLASAGTTLPSEAPTDSLGSWAALDLADVVSGLLDGTLDRPHPDVGFREDGLALFYTSRVNGVYGSSGDGKSWITGHIARQEIEAGATVWWIDFEDDEIGTVARLLDLGTDPTAIIERFRYRKPAVGLGLDQREPLFEQLDLERPTVVVIDSTGEWLGLHGIEGNKDEQVAAWMAMYPKQLARAGAAVILIDHMPHDSKGRLEPIGSQRKKAAISGAAYLVTALAELGRDRIGKSRLTNAKDRNGYWVRGKPAAELILDATQHPYRCELVTPTTTDNDGPAGTHLSPAQQRVLNALDDTEPRTVRKLGDLCANDGTTGLGLKPRTIQQALQILEGAGLAHSPGIDPDGQGGAWWLTGLHPALQAEENTL